jgi:hypothetical protein
MLMTLGDETAREALVMTVHGKQSRSLSWGVCGASLRSYCS